MGAINIKHTGSGSDVTLSSDGTDLLLDGTAVGGGGTALELYAENPVSPTAPSATGNEALAIGSGSVATNASSFAAAGATSSGLSSISIGYSADSTSGNSIAIGRDAQALASAAIAIGRNSYSIGSYGAAVGQSYASGTDSFAAAIANNTSSYGATGANSVAIGQLAKATNTNSIAIGDTALSTTANLIALGGSTDTVQISGAYTLPTSDGANNQVLTTDGAGGVTFADISNPLELYAENPDSPTAPSATGTNAVAIGSGASANVIDSIAVGGTAYVGNSYSISLGYDARVSGGEGATALGRNSRAASSDAVAIGKSYASGTDSFAAAIANNTSSYGATDANSVAIGKQAKATDTGAVAIGDGAVAEGTAAVALGFNNSSRAYSLSAGRDSYALGFSSVAMGYDVRSVYPASIALGRLTETRVESSFAFGSYGFGSRGDCQSGLYVLNRFTTDATATALIVNGYNSSTAASTTNQIVLPNNSVYGFTGIVIAREDSASADDFAIWEIKGGAVRGATASTTALGSYNINKISESAGASAWSIALSADTTNGAVAITVTGEAAHNIRWVATVNTTEVIY